MVCLRAERRFASPCGDPAPAAREQQLRAADWVRMRAAIRALAEVARARTGPLLEGGRGFALATKPEDGLFYVGEAQAQAEFAAFCAKLQFPPSAIL